MQHSTGNPDEVGERRGGGAVQVQTMRVKAAKGCREGSMGDFGVDYRFNSMSVARATSITFGMEASLQRCADEIQQKLFWIILTHIVRYCSTIYSRSTSSAASCSCR